MEIVGVAEIERRIAILMDGGSLSFGGVRVERKHGSWWVQADGGCTFHKTPRRAAEQAKRLIRSNTEAMR